MMVGLGASSYQAIMYEIVKLNKKLERDYV